MLGQCTTRERERENTSTTVAVKPDPLHSIAREDDIPSSSDLGSSRVDAQKMTDDVELWVLKVQV